MKLDTKQILKGYDGEPARINDKEISLDNVLINALAYEDGEIKPTAIEKMRAYKLSVDIYGGTVELNSEDIVFIKGRLLVMGYTPIIYGQVVEMLEPKEKSE